MKYINNQPFIQLPQPDLSSAKSLEYALQNRMSERAFNTDKELSLQDLSNLIWATYGVNRDNEKGTAPLLWKVGFYVATEHGIYKHDVKSHSLTLIESADVRSKLSDNKWAHNAPAVFIFTIDTDDMSQHWVDYTGGKNYYIGNMHGYMSQNLYLAASGLDMATCAISWYHHKEVDEMLGLKGNDQSGLIQAVGYRK